jgi:hypothetical protein
MSPPTALRYYTAPFFRINRTGPRLPYMPDFWRHSGYHLTTSDGNGDLVPTDDFLRAYFARPEIAPVAQSCVRERDMFDRLMVDPYMKVGVEELAGLADRDARENYAIVLRFRDHLVAAGTLEAAYRSLFIDAHGKAVDFAAHGLPPLFADQLVQIILRGILEPCSNGLQARAAELMFRVQRAHVDDGQVLLADLETIEARMAVTPNVPDFGNIGRLLAQAQTQLRKVELDVLADDNADCYWARDERHDVALQLNFGRPGLAALCRVIELWVMHFFRVRVRVEPVRGLDSARMRWFVGLDSVATMLMNDIYNGIAPDEERRRRILCMMKLEIDEADEESSGQKSSPVYLSLAMDEQGNTRMKPQNLLTNLPFGLRL